MRAATVVSGSIILIGIYLAVAAVLAFTPTWVALGLLAISLVAALSIVLAPDPSRRRLPSA